MRMTTTVSPKGKSFHLEVPETELRQMALERNLSDRIIAEVAHVLAKRFIREHGKELLTSLSKEKLTQVTNDAVATRLLELVKEKL